MTDTKDQLRALRERRLKAIGKETRMATEYVILKKVEGDRNWQVLAGGTHAASSSSAALRAALNGKNETGEFVAIPTRSWKPVKVKVETALKFS